LNESYFGMKSDKMDVKQFGAEIMINTRKKNKKRKKRRRRRRKDFIVF